MSSSSFRSFVHWVCQYDTWWAFSWKSICFSLSRNGCSRVLNALCAVCLFVWLIIQVIRRENNFYYYQFKISHCQSHSNSHCAIVTHFCVGFNQWPIDLCMWNAREFMASIRFCKSFACVFAFVSVSQLFYFEQYAFSASLTLRHVLNWIEMCSAFVFTLYK